MINILLHHLLLIIVAGILECLLQIKVDLLEVSSELPILDLESLAFILDSFCGFFDASNSKDKYTIFFKGSCIQNVDLL
jgi:hypothetical protein